MIKYSLQSQISTFLVRHYLVVSLFSVAIILAMGYFLYLRPYADRVLVMQETSLNMGRQRIDEQKQYLSDLQSVEKYYSGISDDVHASIERALPTQPEVAIMYTELESLALANGMQINSLDFSEKPQEKNSVYRAIEVSVTVFGGDYEKFKAFLVDIESNLRIYDVVSIKYSPDAYVNSVNFLAYYLPANMEK